MGVPNALTTTEESPTRVINYLAGYMAGTAIGNSRIVEDDGRYVSFECKDYRDGQKKVAKMF